MKMSWTTACPSIYINISNLTSGTSDVQFNESDDCANNTGVLYTPYDKRPETYIVPIVFFLILIIGVTGNGVLVLTILRHANMRNVPNTYVLSLALGDLLVIVTCVPFTATIYTIESWPFGTAVCKISECAKDISIGVSVFTLTALSADRFFAIVDPLRKLHATGGGKRATRFTNTIAGLIWLLAIGFAVPASFAYIRIKQVNNTTSFMVCYPFPEEYGVTYARWMIVSRFFIYYLIPLFIIGIFYLLMARHLFQSTKKIPGEMQGQEKQIKARKKVARMVLAFVAVFAVCFFPQHVFMLWFYFNPTFDKDYNGFWHTFRIVGFCLAFMNSCINPIALYFVSGSFRKYFNRYLLCCCLMKKNRSRLSMESNRHAQSFSLSTRRHQNSKRQCGTQSSRQSYNNFMKIADTCLDENRRKFHSGIQKRDHQQPEQETMVSICNNGLEQRA
ncbi:neuropeptide CCHamide-1 receptor-like [Venturia canescens]|uniref:neuropeptide CCHamide-1 receptor-like n=1 Tax=Venturia canescens TaxID=32260 RepID=UPI001C9CFB75|nr:neuropeptide CCHamide-1 receptor-like [Venturia canescens]